MYHSTATPSEEEIQKVMRETGMDYLQARNHVIARLIMRERMLAQQNRRR